MSKRKAQGVLFTSIERFELDGVTHGLVRVTAVPVGGLPVVGLLLSVEKLRDLAAFATLVADAVEARRTELAR